MAGRKRYARKRTKKRSMRRKMSRRKMTASAKLMAQGYSGTRRMKFTQMFALGVNAAVGPNGGCCLVNIPLLNNGLSTATNFYRLVGP